VVKEFISEIILLFGIYKIVNHMFDVNIIPQKTVVTQRRRKKTSRTPVPNHVFRLLLVLILWFCCFVVLEKTFKQMVSDI